MCGWKRSYVGVGASATVAVTQPTLSEMFDDTDEQLFTRILTNQNHVLQSYLPERTRPQYNLRTITHNKELIAKTSELNTRDFIIKCCTKTATDNL